MRKTRQDRDSFCTRYNYCRLNIIIKPYLEINSTIKFYSMKSFLIIILSPAILLVSCNNKDKKYDASGNFESDEVIVSAEQTGKLLSFTIKEGDTLSKGQHIGQIEVTNIVLQKEQAEATIRALRQK